MRPALCHKCRNLDPSGWRTTKQAGNHWVQRYHVGTSESMRCPDCSDPEGRPMCRDCCPTAHQTKETP